MPQAGHKIKVVCRVRPFLTTEKPDDAVSVEPNNVLRVTNPRDTSKDVKFNLDSCYGPDETQETIYRNDVQPLVDTIFDGMSATVFCYGVTGAGKTYTIQGTERDPGIIPRTLEHIFLRQQGNALDYDTRISYYEIYKEAVYDLLVPRESVTALPIREDANRKIFVAGLSEKKVTSMEQFEAVYQKACRNRRTASTKLNSHSSRSHAILTVQVQWTDGGKTWCGRVHLIDLAGSEDNRRTANNKDRLAESSAINRSLFVLGQVVEALNSGSLRVPYRDSKMTRILQDSLGGESMGMLIVNVAPGKGFLQETHNTLNFATKSREVVNKPVAHEVVEPQWTVADRLQHHRGFGRPMRSGAVLAASGIKRRRFDENQAFENDRSPSEIGSNANRERLVSRRRISPAATIKSSVRQTLAHRTSDRMQLPQGDFVDRVVSKKFHEIEQKTESASQEIMERVMRIEKQLQEPKLDTDVVLDLFTPTTKLKTSRGWIKYARELEHNGEVEKALVHYEEALRYAPELNKLEAHIAKLRAKIRRERRRSSIASQGSANMRVADRESADSGLLSKGDGGDSDDEGDAGPLWLVDGLAESPGAEKVKRQKVARESGHRKRIQLMPKPLVFERATKSNEMTPTGAAPAVSRDKSARSLSKRARLSAQPISTTAYRIGNAENTLNNGKSSLRAKQDDRLKRKAVLSSSQKPGLTSPEAVRLRKSIREPTTPDDHNDKDFVPSSDGSDAEEAELLRKVATYGSARRSKRQKGSKQSANSTSATDIPSPDDTSHTNSKRGLGAGASTKGEDALSLGTFNDICIASALQIINSGDLKKIMKLQGIGKRRAEQIQASILANGPVSNVADLKDRLHFKDKIIVGILSTFA